ncbi:8-oxoguanine DNA glycosylase isoform X1 [Lasioglossum baleicum]|uniref:8-oxoguanine DNA glycosylase isoform X1 n=1 Tax=Lasioglossum baleicum TaxID=434251 RepID=UPI003FCC6784
MLENEARSKQGKISCPREQLDLGVTLKGGQSFRWVAENDGYRGVFNGCVWMLKQDDTHLFYVVQGPLDDSKNYNDILHRYFRLDVSLPALCKEWCAIDKHFQKSLDKVNGVRILNQEVVENVFSFICSSNNNIQRISMMVEKLCSLFGERICSIEGKDYYSFPSVEALANRATEEQLRNEKFGYRSKFITSTAKRLMEFGGRDWLLGLHKDNNVSYSNAKKELIVFPGVGPKVADCICLMSLGHLEAVPVDVHIQKIAMATYFSKKQEKISNDEVGNRLRKLWGPYAGWAQAVIFCVELNADRKVPSKRNVQELDVACKTHPKKANQRRKNCA